jgi:UDPglucose 6-dehydrogenase
MRIAIFGVGYVGLVQAAALAEVGNDVIAVDVDAAKVAALQAGRIDIYEPGLDKMVSENVQSGRLHFSTDAKAAIEQAQLIFIAVGTPSDEDGSADLRFVLEVAATIGTHMDTYRCIVVKSTVPVGTCERVHATIGTALAERGREIDYDVASNPEFLKEGSALADFQRPDRIIIGVDGARPEQMLRELYRPYNRNSEKIIVMDIRSSELTKYAANSLLATKISFMNEMSNIASRVGADIERVRLGIGADPRIGYQFLYAGAGYGGACFPKDVRALIKTAQDTGFDAWILRSVEARNLEQKRFMLDRIVEHYGDDLARKRFALWGLSFKPNTNDMREAPSRVIMEELWARGAEITAYDPQAMDECRRLYPNESRLQLASSKETALEGSDALIVVTEWRAFQSPDFHEIRATLRDGVIFDCRNIYDPAIVAAAGLRLQSVGRPSIPPTPS